MTLRLQDGSPYEAFAGNGVDDKNTFVARFRTREAAELFLAAPQMLRALKTLRPTVEALYADVIDVTNGDFETRENTEDALEEQDVAVALVSATATT